MKILWNCEFVFFYNFMCEDQIPVEKKCEGLYCLSRYTGNLKYKAIVRILPTEENIMNGKLSLILDTADIQ